MQLAVTGIVEHDNMDPWQPKVVAEPPHKVNGLSSAEVGEHQWVHLWRGGVAGLARVQCLRQPQQRGEPSKAEENQQVVPQQGSVLCLILALLLRVAKQLLYALLVVRGHENDPPKAVDASLRRHRVQQHAMEPAVVI